MIGKSTLASCLVLVACGSGTTTVVTDGGSSDAADDGAVAADGGTCGRSGTMTCFTDPTTQLMWENPTTPGACNWQAATDDCSVLSACGHDDWRLPNIDELRTLMKGCVGTDTGGACPIHVGSSQNDFNNTCYCTKFAGQGPGGCYWDPAFGDQCGYFTYLYWSSSVTALTDKTSWAASYFDGRLLAPFKTDKQRVRCVRP